MILPFSQYWPERMGELAGQKNHFVEKIWKGFNPDKMFPIKTIVDYAYTYKFKFGAFPDWYLRGGVNLYHPKLHTIRHDPNGRWKPGMKIHPRINNRTKNSFQFAPTLECVSVQKIKIEHFLFGKIPDEPTPILVIDGRHFYNPKIGIDRGMEQLALNDGFPSVEAFFQWFNEDFKGVIVNWTPLKY